MRFPPPNVQAGWPAPNDVNPVTRGPTLVRTDSALMAISIIVVALRAYVRKFLIYNLGWDDWLMFMSLVSSQSHIHFISHRLTLTGASDRYYGCRGFGHANLFLERPYLGRSS